MPQPKKPLTRAELREIWVEAPLPAVHALLWEIHRLRSLVLCADQIQRRLREHGALRKLDETTVLLIQGLRNNLEREPCVIESEAGRAELINYNPPKPKPHRR